MTDITTAPTDAWNRHGGLVALAVGYQWFYNGVNFLAFKVSGDAMHPVVVATLRFGGAALLILPLALWRLRSHPTTARQLASAAAIGVVMLVAGQTLSIWGTHFLPAGVASVFGSAPPLFLALFAWLLFRQPLARRQVAGVAIGFAGLAFMGLSSAENAGFHVAGAVLTLVASAAWAGGSLLATRVSLPSDPVVGLATQLVAASLLLAVVAEATGIMSRTEFARIPLAAWGALAFLILASTLIGYAVFLALNRAASPTLANTYNYVAPVIALALSALLLGEPLTWFKGVAAAVALAGVTLMLGTRSSPATKARS